MINKILPVIFIASLFSVPVQIANASGIWTKASNTRTEIRREKRKGNIATSLQCRNNPKTTNRLDPQIKFNWKPNTNDVEWIALTSGGYDNWKPGSWPGEEQRWNRISNGRFASSTGAVFCCSLWHHKSQKATQSKAIKPIHSLKSNSSVVSKSIRQ